MWGWVPLGNVRQVTCIPMANCYLKCQEPCLKHNDDFAQSVTTLKFESHIKILHPRPPKSLNLNNMDDEFLPSDDDKKNPH